MVHRGAPIVTGKRVTGFANSEEEVRLTHVVPFLVEDELKRLGEWSAGSSEAAFPTPQRPAPACGVA